MFLLTISYVYLVFVVPLAILPSLSIALWRYKSATPAMRAFTIYLLVSGITNFVAVILASKRINNLPLLHVYTLAQFIIISLCYRAIFYNYPTLRKLIAATTVLFSFFCILNSLYLQSIYSYNSYSLSLCSIIIFIYTVLFFMKMLDDVGFYEGAKGMPAWISSAFMIYFGGSLFLFIGSNITHDNQFMNKILWDIHGTLVLIMYVFFTIGQVYGRKN